MWDLLSQQGWLEDKGKTSGLGMQPQPKQGLNLGIGKSFMVMSNIVTVYKQHTCRRKIMCTQGGVIPCSTRPIMNNECPSECLIGVKEFYLTSFWWVSETGWARATCSRCLASSRRFIRGFTKVHASLSCFPVLISCRPGKSAQAAPRFPEQSPRSPHQTFWARCWGMKFCIICI